MNFTINTDTLKKHLFIVSKAITNKTNIPNLSGVLFIVKSNSIDLIGKSSNLEIKVTIPSHINDKEVINIKQEGTFNISETFISDIIKKVEDENVSFESMDGEIIKVSTKAAKFNINGFVVDEYPKVNFIDSEDILKVNSTDLLKVIRQTVFAISKNENRPVLTGVNFEFLGNIINVNATDSYRLSYKTFTHDNNLNANLIIPGKNLFELVNVLGENIDVEMHIFNNKLMIKYDNVIFQSNLLEGTYPQTKKLIPEEFETEIMISKTALINSIERASVLSRDKTKNVVKLTIGDGVKISSSSPEVGKVEEAIVAEVLKSGDFEISFGARFVKEALQSFDCDKLTIKFNGDMKPFIIVNPEDNSIIQLVLPVRTY